MLEKRNQENEEKKPKTQPLFAQNTPSPYLNTGEHIQDVDDKGGLGTGWEGLVESAKGVTPFIDRQHPEIFSAKDFYNFVKEKYSLNSPEQVEKLLQAMKNDPTKALKLANLVLDYYETTIEDIEKKVSLITSELDEYERESDKIVESIGHISDITPKIKKKKELMKKWPKGHPIYNRLAAGLKILEDSRAAGLPLSSNTFANIPDGDDKSKARINNGNDLPRASRILKLKSEREILNKRKSVAQIQRENARYHRDKIQENFQAIYDDRFWFMKPFSDYNPDDSNK